MAPKLKPPVCGLVAVIPKPKGWETPTEAAGAVVAAPPNENGCTTPVGVVEACAAWVPKEKGWAMPVWVAGVPKLKGCAITVGATVAVGVAPKLKGCTPPVGAAAPNADCIPVALV